MRLFAGVDLGATNVRVALSDHEGRIICRLAERTVRDGEDGFVVTEQIRDMIKGALSSSGFGLSDLRAIGIGSIGPLDIREGVVKRAANLPYEKIPLVVPLADEFRVPVRLLNDCVSAVLGETRFGMGKGVENVVYVTLSTGIGAGAVVDGHLLIGKDGNAHEVGHMVVDFEGRLTCGCGMRGHWEAYCGGKGIPQYARLLTSSIKGEEMEHSQLAKRYGEGLSGISPEALFEAAKLKDPLALHVVSAIGELNSMGFANIVSVYDPDLITVGGSIALNNQDLILEPIRGRVASYTVNRPPEIAITPLGGDVGLYGAIAAALEAADG
jgi:glucokinase